jgi:hypothetical protein
MLRPVADSVIHDLRTGRQPAQAKPGQALKRFKERESIE